MFTEKKSMKSSMQQTHSCWEQRLGDLIQKTSANLKKLQASYEHSSLDENTFHPLVKYSCDAPDSRQYNTLLCQTKPQINCRFGLINSNADTGEPLSILPSSSPIENRCINAPAEQVSMSTRTRVVCKQVEESMMRRMEQSMRIYLDRIVEDRIAIKLGEALVEHDLENDARKINDDNEITLIWDKYQAISNGVSRLAKEIRTLRYELDALSKSKNDLRLQQTQSDERHSSFINNLQQQIESMADTNEKYRQQVNQQLKIATSTIIPAIQEEVKSLQDVCRSDQNQLATLSKRCDVIEEKESNKLKKNSSLVTETLSALTNIMSPVLSKLQDEVCAIKNHVIQATANDKRGVSSLQQAELEAVMEPFMAKAISQMNKKLFTDLHNFASRHNESESKKLHVLFQDLKDNLNDSLENRFCALAEEISSFQQDVLIKRVKEQQDDLQLFGAKCKSFIEEHIINKIREKMSERVVQKSKKQSSTLSPQAEKFAPIADAMEIIEEWINGIVSNALLSFTFNSIENKSDSSRQNLFFRQRNAEGDVDGDGSNCAVNGGEGDAISTQGPDETIPKSKTRSAMLNKLQADSHPSSASSSDCPSLTAYMLSGESYVGTVFENSERQPQVEQQIYGISELFNQLSTCTPSVDYGLVNLKEQLRKEIMEQASRAFENMLQQHFDKFNELMWEKINESFVFYNTELTRVKVDAEAIYRFHRKIENDLDHKLTYIQQKWSEDLYQSKLELASLSARCDDGQMQQQCLQTAFKSISDLTLKFQERVGNTMAQISSLKAQYKSVQDLILVKQEDRKHSGPGEADIDQILGAMNDRKGKNMLDFECSFQPNTPQTEQVSFCNTTYRDHIQLETEQLAMSLDQDKLALETRTKTCRKNSEECSNTETNGQDNHISNSEDRNISHATSHPCTININFDSENFLSAKDECIDHSGNASKNEEEHIENILKGEGQCKEGEEENKNEENRLFNGKSHPVNNEILAQNAMLSSAHIFPDKILNYRNDSNIQYLMEELNGAEASVLEINGSEKKCLVKSIKEMSFSVLRPAAASVSSLQEHHESMKEHVCTSATRILLDSVHQYPDAEVEKIAINRIETDEEQIRSGYMIHNQHSDNQNEIAVSHEQNFSVSDDEVSECIEAIEECIEIPNNLPSENEDNEEQGYSLSFDSSSLL